MSRKLRRKHQNRPSFLVQLPLIYVDPPADLEAVADWLHEYRWVVGTFGNLQAMTLSGMAYKHDVYHHGSRLYCCGGVPVSQRRVLTDWAHHVRDTWDLDPDTAQRIVDKAEFEDDMQDSARFQSFISGMMCGTVLMWFLSVTCYLVFG